ncbi:glycosyl transferase [Candidatus Roizmanbacteria bacterium RIFCSPLOWO2_02_FULL_37_19]|uniref:Glycosyl transferase n=1 Tax=Candidatus Roizmanbacteria bacterium RIFCSPHIGHO2_02_FULL_37_24 TaxID=1802037 RepID=A0A1F7H084_9BACT|nr:MAG: glycosyl transferase [Candidatus Roizmanbacteria bacterium RIFCSPHIGHO2_01_FULL_38_41]OGK24800.1 MAG: glycosyl transferase [Candidatus Roizmanbacteria bacterium RIFCSPHIGHO2_02_FULL_37_24]OGK32802.1 MAG: glycosyl transferase [Candidatus Roizmanbacteria bacterium RIFCSPHIGHO2_12_FULL_37_23]OGK45572.1 MAG: glycosyl transferase [Candidatus Roizmanbacteria bacterium RIFCSPLOWO2_01_FULL_37_57]OGK53616.1 MAG: glycosyl transferase [Candidatus Roizmanbacteria bacterium RIFCSPLOWO2_02_FULL_37_19
MKYSIIIPVYNEESIIQELYDRTSKVMQQLKSTYELIFVNDGSSDNSPHALVLLHNQDHNVKVINFSRNFGHQVAVNAGMRYSTGEFIAIIDADLQDPPEELPRFFKKLSDGYDVVYGIRKKRKESLLKKSAYSFFYRLLKAITFIDIPVDSGDFSVMNRKVVDAINLLPERNRFIRGLRSWIGMKQIGLEYERDRRYGGKSKYNPRKLFKLAFDGIFSFSYVPLEMIFYLGLIGLATSAFGALAVVYFKFFTEAYKAVPGFATTTLLIIFIGGLNLFSIGILGEYLRRVYDEVKQRPEYIVESTIGF